MAPPLRRGASPTPRRGGAGRRRYRRGACSARRLAELALSGGADADEAASGELHMIISLSAPAELALTGAANAEAPVAPGASPTQTKASLHTKEIKDIAGASLSARRGGRLPSRVARRSLSGPR